jgi:6-pyruvoyltetrahydropterin/6-carboxytetrahydropterin synthase
MSYESTKIIELGSCAFRQWRADSHCKFIHGYRLVAKFWFGCNTLDGRNWVVDFGGLKELKNILEKQFDHTLCVAEDDPLIEGFKSLHAAGGCDLRIMPGGVGIEKTAEWCYNTAAEHCNKLTNGRCWVNKVEVWEHEKNSAIFSTEATKYNIQQENNTIATTMQPPINQVVEFLKDVEAESGVNVSTVIKNIPNMPQNGPGQPGARVGPGVKTSGWSNVFSGTSWGN